MTKGKSFEGAGLADISPMMLQAGERAIIAAQESGILVPDLLAIRVFHSMLEVAQASQD
jgi:hypothetical protein